LCKERMKKQISTLEVKNWLMTVIKKYEKETDEKSIST
jgi:hypothetical protein